MKGRLKSFDYRHILAAAVTIGFMLITAFVFRGSVLRLITSGRDFGLSCAYWFCRFFGLPSGVEATVLIPQPATDIAILPETFAELLLKLEVYGSVVFTGESVKLYLLWLLSSLNIFAQVLTALIPVVLVFVLALKRYLKSENNDYDKQSRPLRLYLKLEKRVILPVKHWLIGCKDFILERPNYYRLWLLTWMINFNVLSIAVSFTAYYLYFSVTFDVASLYTQAYKLVVDLAVPILVVPLWVWGVALIIFRNWWRRRIALRRLNGMERANREFIASMPHALMIVGTMGKKKTTLLTDIALSQHVMFREKAFEILLLNDLKFRRFPWLAFELKLKEAMNAHEVYNLATCEIYVRANRAAFESDPSPAACFGYDYERYGLTCNNNLVVSHLFETLETYAKAYFIYVIQSSLLIANYSVREDLILNDTGNFPVWDTDFFERDPGLMEAYSRHAHILDFDMLRLGKKILADNKKRNAFEFGVVLMTEIGKERGNQNDTQGMKRDDEDTNQKNDNFNRWLKTVRHSATVDNFPFVLVLSDDQRPESLNADMRELNELIRIVDSGDRTLSMPFFSFGEILHDLLLPRYRSAYYKYRHNRADETLFMRAFKSVCGRLICRYERIYNSFAYYPMELQTESGTMKSGQVSHRYYLMSKKIYSNRFSTDCYSDFFMEKALQSEVGIADLDAYVTSKASFDEITSQHSYLGIDLFNDLRSAALPPPDPAEDELARIDKIAKYRKKQKDKTDNELWVKGLKPDELAAFHVYMEAPSKPAAGHAPSREDASRQPCQR